ncbi:Crp/Fnr family transcriptional regulator [Hydrogenovibrio sp. JE_KL2]|uniref:Crp/Fnr family transcriptional regulator n=1 Tax=Hydrogenovibrio sp. JE_KL2 TaxID=2651188 RepID=UPI00128C3C93|nr:Crp/Fnr family transcriptional regulator [Hydrogenovibrio sp. JE_KL2]MPQ76898.1 Crp/Fnr family transcriptional regulator [Hydrogenovibrio sp. JE_KL2]
MKQAAQQSLKKVLDSYYPISEETWQDFLPLLKLRELAPDEILYAPGELSKSFAFVIKGLIRSYSLNEKGNEYNKNFFYEGRFPGSMTSLLTATPSELTFEALEPTTLFEIDFVAYRKLMHQKDDLKLLQIHYLEKHWLLEKDAREVEIVQEDASERYQRFLMEHPNLAKRLPQYHIASHLGITPTQLSRIRKKI